VLVHAQVTALVAALLVRSAVEISDRLSDLAEAGLIARTVDEGPPLAVSYALTDRGNALIPALAEISLWAQEHLPEDRG
jgi:DNA-binding HxlR family transcriptional regulator